MGHGPRYRVKWRRRREGKTDYRRRLALLKSGQPRAVVRRSHQNFIVQFIAYDEEGDRVLAQAEAQELKNFGWDGATGNTPAAYLTGLLAAHRAAGEGVEEAVLDMGRQVPAQGGTLFAALKGVLDGGVHVPHGENIFPDEERLRGEHAENGTAAAFDAVKAEITGEPAPTNDAAEASDAGESSEDASATEEEES